MTRRLSPTFSRSTLLALVAFVAASASCGGAPAPRAAAVTRSGGAASGQEPHAITWHKFGPEAFAQARREKKLVLVDAGIEGCTACRWMYEDTYRDAEVLRRIDEHFVAVSVDADVEPDLGARFEPWGWPATIFLTADGEQVLALRGNERPRGFVPILDDLVRRKANGTLRPSNEARAATASPAPKDLAAACLKATTDLDASTDAAHGGWGKGPPKFVQAAAVEEALLRGHVESKAQLGAHAVRTASAYANMIDRVWGGTFVAARHEDFTAPIVEKRLVQEADALSAFTAAYAATRDDRFRALAGEIDRYVAAFLLDPDGTFYSTQQDLAPDLPEGMSPMAYYELPDEARRKYGVPPVDHAVYTDQNGKMIGAYARLYAATGDANARARAEKAATTILASRVRSEGWALQAAPSRALASDARKRAFAPEETPYLLAQVHLLGGLLALYEATGEARWLGPAKSLARAMRDRLEDRAVGGFFARPEGAGPKPDKPREENLLAARALHRLAVVTRDAELDAAAARTLRATGGDAGGALFALAAEELALGPVEMSVVGDAEDPRARALYQAALAVDEPRKVVHFEGPGHYPDRGHPTLYVCTRSACSSPVDDPARVATIAATQAHARSACDDSK